MPDSAPGHTFKVTMLSPNRGQMGETWAVPRLGRGLAAAGCQVDLLNARREWKSVEPVSFDNGGRLSVQDLGSSRFIPWIPDVSRVSPMVNYRLWAAFVAAGMLPSLVSYLRREQPDFLVARMLTVPAIVATLLARSRTKLILSMAGFPRRSRFRGTLWPRMYQRADGYVAPTAGVAAEASDISGVPIDQFRVIPNAVVDESTYSRAAEAPAHEWLTNKTAPVILGAGRLTRQKDFPTLIRAFAEVRRRTMCRLIIIGAGEDENRTYLEQLTVELGVSADVSMPGFQANPYSFMKASDVYVMSSLWEGPGHALIEALALGTPCVSTDCPDGPRDTLMDGKAGLLVPVGDHLAMAEAILSTLTDREAAESRAKVAVQDRDRFEIQGVTAKWMNLFWELAPGQ